MNEIKNPTKILNILISLLTFLILTKGEIFNNPYSISTNVNPIKVKENGYYYILTSGRYFILDSTWTKIAEDDFPTYNSPYTWIKDESNNNYIFAKDKYIQVTFNEKTISYNVTEKPTAEGMEYPDSSVHIGSMTETSTGDRDDCLCPIEENEVIIYGKGAPKYLVFTFLKKKVSYKIGMSNSLEDKIDCKIMQNRDYLCVFTYSKSVYLYFYSHIINQDGKCAMIRKPFNPFKTHTYVQLFDYDIKKKTYLICAKNINSNKIECILISFTKKKSSECSTLTYSVGTKTMSKFPTSSGINQDLILNDFGGEKLYCYGEIGFIKCYRVTKDTNIVNTFTLEIPGSNSKLSFFTDGNTYGNFIFYNDNSGSTNLYEYFIYLPSCQNLVYSIIIYHSITEDKKVDLNGLFERKTNTKYYIEFETLPHDYGDLKVNNETILGENSKILLENEQSYFLDFISTNNKTVTNFTIPYKILINETYSKKCSIDLTILPCYDSCAECSKDNSSSFPLHHRMSIIA